ncbi:rapamycin-insensitive companion of mTOR [Trichonephila clavata]|uniref:Rapamycin-insensitive companion of mTOR n=1 Tax=Trichonephila clavata TaxID=2740835 RepID=A0A8X6F828_TRICU|nr:rapamycin-insensitive companion of mTOR [Trichonephila clavata]
MAVSHGLRQHSKFGARFRKRRDSEEENIYLDFNRATPEIVQEILFNVVNQDVNISKKLGYLNGFVKLCVQKQKEFGISYRDIFCCLRIAFFHEACEVRAAGLRACRYVLKNLETVETFLQSKLQFLVSRSLDISLDNRIERVQALRLMRKVLDLNPKGFPSAFSKCLVAIANEGSQERDMIRPCLATLAQLAVLNPQACIEAKGVSALMKNIVEIPQVQASEAILGVIFFLINHPSTRDLMNNDFGLENLLAPFTDCHYRFPSTLDGCASEDKDPNLNSSKAAIVCALLSWPGLMYLCRSNACHLQSLVEMLYLPYPDLRKNILDLLYKIFDISIPEWTDDFSIALNSSDPSALKSSWQLYEGYIVAEGLDVLPYSSKDRTNLVYNYHALLVLVFVNCGLLEALSEVIVTSEVNLAVRTTVFLGEFIYMANQFLPIDCSHLSNCLPTLISSAASFESSRKQNQATAALTCLFRIHELKKKGAVPNSLVLSNLLHICNPDREKKGFFVGTVNKIKLWKYLKQEMTDGIDQAIRDTLVLSKDYQCWDWDLIDCILKNPSDSFKRLEDNNHRTFIKKLLHFFKPSSKEFSEMEFDKENGRSICVTGCHLLEFFLELDEIKAQEYLDDFLNDLNSCFVQLTKDGDRLNSILSPIKVSSTFSQIYFLFIGKLSSTHKGCKFLNRCSTFQNLFHLVSVTNQDIYIKLIVSSLDYTKEGFSRAILTKVLTGTEEATRLYATNFLLILLRAKLPDYRKWAIEVLVYQLHDSSKLVSAAALDILDEACTIQENLEALISLRPSLLQLGDKGLLLLVRYLSVQSGFNFLQESNFLCCELERWQQVYNYKYVKVVEDLLNEAFTHHRRGIEGTYGRRSSDMSHSVRNVYLPPHMYGQLVQHAEGVKVLQNNGVLPELFHNIRYPDFSTDTDILHLKASLWAVGHIGSYSLGLRIIIKENLILNIVDLAASAPVFAVRGTCYFVLGLLSSTIEGADALREYGWEAVQRNHEEKWPLIKEEFLVDASQMARKSTWSFSSMSSDWPLGALPTSLSFIVRTSQFDLTRSQSQISNTSTEDILQNSCINLQTHYNSFADHDSTSNNSRPRSSSDCQTDIKENALLQVAESSSWDALNSYSSFTLPVDFKRYTKRRSISTSEVDMKTFDFHTESDVEEVDENEVTNSKVAFFHADEDLPEPKQHSLSHSNVHPVASESSINSSKSSDGCVERPSLLKQLSRGHSLHLHSPVSPDKPSPLLLTSARDALGYATLKDIQRRRVNSLSFHDASSTQVDVSLRYLKSQSLDADSAKVFNVPNDLLFSETEEDSIKSRNLSQDTDTVESRFIGLSLPSNLDFILHVPKHCDEPESEIEIVPPKSDAATNSKDPDSAFEFHSEENCISNHSFADKRSLQRTIIDEESEEQSSVTVKSNEDTICKKILPLERSNSVKGLLKYRDDSLNSQYLIRKEAMHYVTNLCSSIAVKASEQGLLNLKQKFPSSFQDICLYSEISYYMANYNFRLNARRFLQELFLDVSFEQLQLEAEAVISIISIPQMGGSEV